MATHSSTRAWKIAWTEEPGSIQSMGLQRVGHDCVTNFHFLTDIQCRVRIQVLISNTQGLLSIHATNPPPMDKRTF